MTITTKPVVCADTDGTCVEFAEFADNKTWAKLTIYANGENAVVLEGTPRELRKIAGSITRGLRRERIK